MAPFTPAFSNKARISQTKTVGELSPRQRIQLIELLHQ
jgi:hypothetical protein